MQTLYPTAKERDRERKISKRTWEVGGRYGYSAVDEYLGDGMQRTTITGISRKNAEIIAGSLADAYSKGIYDAIRAMRPSLSKDGES